MSIEVSTFNAYKIRNALGRLNFETDKCYFTVGDDTLSVNKFFGKNVDSFLSWRLWSALLSSGYTSLVVVLTCNVRVLGVPFVCHVCCSYVRRTFVCKTIVLKICCQNLFQVLCSCEFTCAIVNCCPKLCLPNSSVLLLQLHSHVVFTCAHLVFRALASKFSGGWV